jgi:hypothetical protein
VTGEAERTFATRATVPGADRYREVVLDDDEDYTDDPGPDAAEIAPPGIAPPETATEIATLEIAGHAAPAPIERFRRTAIGTAFAAGLLGLSDALEGRKEPTPAIVEDWAGGEPFKEPIVLRLDPDHPEDSIVMVRPWLKRGPGDSSPTDG